MDGWAQCVMLSWVVYCVALVSDSQVLLTAATKGFSRVLPTVAMTVAARTR